MRRRLRATPTLLLALLIVLIVLTAADVVARVGPHTPQAHAAPHLTTAAKAPATHRDIAYSGDIEGIGDSLWAGYYATSPSETFRALIERHYRAADITPSGTGYGLTAASVSAAFAAGTIAVKPASLVIIELGTNDDADNETLAQFTSDYGNVVWWVRREIGTSPLLCLGIWNDGQDDGLNALGIGGAQYDAIIRQSCAGQNGAYLSLEPYAYDVNVAGTSTFLGASDAFHPSSVGHARIAAGILCTLQGTCAA